MSIARLKLLSAGLAAAILGAIVAKGPELPSSEGQSAPPRDPAWVEKRVKEILPTPEEKRFDEIGWIPTLLEARRLAKEHQRPIFLFSHDGEMGTGRC